MTRVQWSEAHIADQHGRVALITGANSGIGFEAARALAQRGAHVVLACRSPERAADAEARIHQLAPSATVEALRLDLSDLDSIDAAANEFATRHDRLDLLINNAGLAMLTRSTTAQGFESQYGVNHLGHFALTAKLLPALLAVEGSRVVTISSYVHRLGRMDFDDLHGVRRYSASGAYAQSKLANLLFTAELSRRLEAARTTTTAVAAHPGASATNLGHDNPGPLSAAFRTARPLLERFLQSPADGALPTLRAATDPAAMGNDFYGPLGRFETSGSAAKVTRSRRARDEDAARHLWQLSVAETGADYGVLDVQGPSAASVATPRSAARSITTTSAPALHPPREHPRTTETRK